MSLFKVISLASIATVVIAALYFFVVLLFQFEIGSYL